MSGAAAISLETWSPYRTNARLSPPELPWQPGLEPDVMEKFYHCGDTRDAHAAMEDALRIL